MITSRASGFTVIETLVTIIIGVMLLVAINTLFVTIIRATVSARSRNDASSLAYSYLRKYANTNSKSTWFTCDTTNPATESDLQQNASAPGWPVESGSLTQAQTSLAQPVTYSVIALAPYGCTMVGAKPPLLVRATVTYGVDKLTVTQATYTDNTQ